MSDEKYEKSIYLYGDEIGKVEYVQHIGSDITVCNAARISFGVEKQELDERDKKLIRYLIKHRHTSTLEHCGVTFKFVVPLYVRSQHHRHRTWSFNEISRRYTDVNLQLYEPDTFRTQHKSNRQASNAEETVNPMLEMYDPACSHPVKIFASHRIRDHHRSALELYDELIEKGVCREQARGVLPQNLYTSYIGTVNMSNLLKFVDLRIHAGAQWEITKVAQACLEIATDLWPETVGSYREIRGE